MIRREIMPLLLIVFLSLFIISSCSKSKTIQEQEELLSSIYNEEFQKSSFTNNLTMDVKHSGAIEELKGFSLFKLTAFVDSVKKSDYYIISDGSYLVSASKLGDRGDDLISKYIVENIIKKREIIEIDKNKAVYLKGDIYGENRATLVVDFHSLPDYNFTAKDYKLLNEENIKGNNIAVDVLLNPSDEHKNSQILSRVFLSAQELDLNLYDNIFNLRPQDYDSISEEDVINIFASFFDVTKSNKFKTLVNSPYIKEKVKQQKEYVSEILEESKTPLLLYNNYPIEGTQEIIAAFLFLSK